MESKREKLAVSIYNSVLDKIEEWLGGGSTFDYQLTDLCRELFGDLFAAVISRRRFIDIIKREMYGDSRKYYIVNLDEVPGGSHWIAIIIDKPKIYVYDSYGRTLLEMFPELISKKKKSTKITDADADPEQTAAEDNCGQRCVAWLFVAYMFNIEFALLI